jgi:hypothetical protein
MHLIGVSLISRSCQFECRFRVFRANGRSFTYTLDDSQKARSGGRLLDVSSVEWRRDVQLENHDNFEHVATTAQRQDTVTLINYRGGVFMNHHPLWTWGPHTRQYDMIITAARSLLICRGESIIKFPYLSSLNPLTRQPTACSRHPHLGEENKWEKVLPCSRTRTHRCCAHGTRSWVVPASMAHGSTSRVTTSPPLTGDQSTGPPLRHDIMMRSW